MKLNRNLQPTEGEKYAMIACDHCLKNGAMNPNGSGTPVVGDTLTTRLYRLRKEPTDIDKFPKVDLCENCFKVFCQEITKLIESKF